MTHFRSRISSPSLRPILARPDFQVQLQMIYEFLEILRIEYLIIATNRPPEPHSRVGVSKPIREEHFHDFALIHPGSFQEPNIRGYVAQVGSAHGNFSFIPYKL